MKINKNKQTVLYTHSSIVSAQPTPAIRLNNILGTKTNTSYNYKIIWVPENRDNTYRFIKIIPQYKFGHGLADTSWVDGANGYEWNFDALPVDDHAFLLSSLTNYQAYSDNILVNLQFNYLNNNINIYSSFSNCSSILASRETSLTYYLSLRFKLELRSAISGLEDTIITYFTDFNCGRSSYQNVGNPPVLPWDRDINGNQLPPLAKDPSVFIFHPQQDPTLPPDPSPEPSPGVSLMHMLTLDFSDIP